MWILSPVIIILRETQLIREIEVDLRSHAVWNALQAENCNHSTGRLGQVAEANALELQI